MTDLTDARGAAVDVEHALCEKHHSPMWMCCREVDVGVIRSRWQYTLNTQLRSDIGRVTNEIERLRKANDALEREAQGWAMTADRYADQVEVLQRRLTALTEAGNDALAHLEKRRAGEHSVADVDGAAWDAAEVLETVLGRRPAQNPALDADAQEPARSKHDPETCIGYCLDCEYGADAQEQGEAR